MADLSAGLELEVREAPASYRVMLDSLRVRPGYKQTVVGVIPKDWESIALAHLSAFITKGSTPTTYGFKWEPSGVLFLRSECVSEDGLDLAKSMFISPAAHATLRRSEVCDGDILVTITGNVGRVVRLVGVGNANLNQHIARVRITVPNADSQYVYHYLSQPSIRRRFNSITTGQAYPQISLKQVREAEVALPALPEQRAIAAALSDVDALIASLDKLIAKKRDIKQGAMQQLLTGQRRLPGFSGEWEVKRLGDVAILHKGKGLAKSELNQFGSEPCIHYGELFTRYPETISEILSRTNTNAGVCRSLANDVLMPTSDVTPNGLATASCVQQTGVVLGGDILVIRANSKELAGSFLSYVIRQSRNQVMQLVTGTTVFHLYGSDMKKFEFSMPPIEEQRAIVQILSDMDAEIAALEARRDKTRALKQGMMQELLTGRIRLV